MHGLPPSAGNMTGSLLVAHPTLRDANFRRTIILLSNHSAADGAIGLVLNRRTDTSGDDPTEELNFTGLAGIPLFAGGPVGTDDFLLASLEWDDESDSLEFETYDAPSGIAASKTPSRLRGFFGYAGWSRGQLEAEIAQSAWIVLPPSPDLVAPDNDEDTWRQLMRSISPIHHLLSEMPDDPSLN